MSLKFNTLLQKTLALGSVIVAFVAVDIGVAFAAELEEIVVTARKREETALSIPVAVTAVTQDRMEKYNLTRLEDVSELTPQIQIYRSSAGNGASINIRGIGPETTSIAVQQSVSTVMDGAYYGAGRVINEGMFDARQIEILKGPQSLFFGKNATAGALNIVTNDPGDELEILASAGYETDAKEFFAQGVFSTPLTDTVGLRIAVRHSDMSKGWIDVEPNPAIYDTTAFGGAALDVPAPGYDGWPGKQELITRATVKFQPSDALTFKLKAHYNEYESNSTTASQELVACNGGGANNAAPGFSQFQPTVACTKDWSTSENPFPTALAATNPMANVRDGDLFDVYDSYSFTGSAEYVAEAYTFTSLLNYQHLRNRWGGDFDTSGVPGVYAAEDHSMNAFSAEIRVLTDLDQPINFMVGALVGTQTLEFDQDVIFAGAFNAAALDPEDTYTAYQKNSATDSSTYSVFAQVMWDITERLELSAGGRYHHENHMSYFTQNYVHPAFLGLFSEGRLDERQEWNDVSPEVTLTYSISDNITAWAAYKQSFKPGGFSISGILGVISGTSRDFMFEREKVKGIEAGIKAQLLDRTLIVELDAYNYKFNDLQIDFFNSDVFALITENAGSAKTTGAELQTRWAPPVEGLTLSASIGFNNSRYTNFIAPCWSGQGQDLGCTIFNPGEVPKQQLAGKKRNLAPKWTFVVGAEYERMIGENLMFGLSLNSQSRSKYNSNAFGHPLDWQGSATILNAAVRVGSADDRWQLAVIAKNLTDKYLMLNTIDSPSSGSPPGALTTTVIGDQRSTANRPRSIAIQGTYRF